MKSRKLSLNARFTCADTNCNVTIDLPTSYSHKARLSNIPERIDGDVVAFETENYLKTQLSDEQTQNN